MMTFRGGKGVQDKDSSSTHVTRWPRFHAFSNGADNGAEDMVLSPAKKLKVEKDTGDAAQANKSITKSSGKRGLDGSDEKMTLDDVAGTPSRPRRVRSKPELFSKYHQVNQEIDGRLKRNVSPQKTRHCVTGFEESDPYKGKVFWAKLSSHPVWPSVKLTQEEIDNMCEADATSMKKDRSRFGNVPCVSVLFLGSNSRGVVKAADIWDYSERFDEFTRRKYGKQFELGLEKADEIVLRSLARNRTKRDCIVCQKGLGSANFDQIFDENGKQSLESNENFSGLKICERCYGLAHSKCVEDTGATVNASDNRENEVWFCSGCVSDAPLTIARTRKEFEDRVKSRKRRKSSTATDKSYAAEHKVVKEDSDQKKSAMQDNGIENTNAALLPNGSTRKKKKGSSAHRNIRKIKYHDVVAVDDAQFASITGTREKSQDITDDFCFICLDGGTLNLCDFPGCTRAYHKFCLGNVAQTENETDESSSWYCPWHHCAECGEVERPVRVCSPLSSGGSSGSNAKQYKILPMNMVPGPTNTRSPGCYMSLEHYNARGAEPRPAQSSIPTSGFIHCVGCPVALCKKHHGVNRPAYHNGKTLFPQFTERFNRKGYFKCGHCTGCAINGRRREQLPAVSLGIYLHKIWSRIVNGHENMCKLLMCRIVESDVPKEASDAWSRLKQNGVTNLMEVRNKIWQLRYTSVESFKLDVLLVAKVAAGIFGHSNSTVADTARSMPFILEQAIKVFQKYIENVDMSESLLLSAKTPFGDFSKPCSSGCLYPSVLQHINRVYPSLVSRDSVKSAEDIDNFVTKRGGRSTPPLEKQYSKSANREGKGVVAALAAAAQAIGGFENHLPPSRVTLDEILEQHSLLLRSALRSTASLRDAVKKTFTRFDAGVSDEITTKDVTLGEMRLAAEYKLVISSLKAKNKKLKSLLEIERAARKVAEEKLSSEKPEKNKKHAA